MKSVGYQILFDLLTISKMALRENKKLNQGSQYGVVHSPPWVEPTVKYSDNANWDLI